MRKNKLLKSMCALTTTACIITQLLIYPVILVSADENATFGTNPQATTNVEENINLNPSFGYYDNGYDAPMIEAPAYLGLEQAVVLPSSYSSVAEGYVTSIKNQGSLGTCWAFGPIAAMESYALRHGLVDSPSDIDLSEYALASLTFDDSTFISNTGTATGDKTTTTDIYNCLRNGGNDQYVFKTLTKWAGIMNEADYPYISAGTTESAFDASKVSYIITGQYFINMQNTEHVKQAILDNGAVVGHYNADDVYDADYYKRYHYTYETKGTNHAIAIVGWDDTIPASAFAVADAKDSSKTHTPAGPGAWLIKNSWGSSWGNSGYMWISYYDMSIINTFCCAYQIAPKSEYDYNYQHDGAAVMGYNVNFNVDTFANVFTVNGTGSQAIKAVSFGIEDVNREYSIMIYKNPIEDNPESGVAMFDTPVTGATTYAGYYTVSLPKAVVLESGDTFSVVIKFDSNTRIVTGYGGDIYIGGGGYATANSVCGDNQSYFKYNSNYIDIYENQDGVSEVNFCIKAMLVDYDEEIYASTITSIEKNGDAGFVINWQNVKDGIEYQLLRATGTDGEYSVIYTGTDTSYIDTSASKYITYYYKVRVYDGTTALDSVARSAYIGVEGTEFTQYESIRDGIKLTWIQVDDVDGYKIYRSTDGMSYELVATVDSGNIFIDEDVKYDNRYYYKIKTYVNVSSGNETTTEESTESVVVSIHRVVTAPSYVNVEMNGYDKVSLSWYILDEVDGFKIYRSYFDEADEYVEMEEIADVSGNVYTFQADITDIPRGKNVTFYVKSYMNEDGVKYLSSHVYDDVYIKFRPVANIKWYVSDDRIYVKWDEYVATGMTVTGYTAGVYSNLLGTNYVTSHTSDTNSFTSVAMVPGNVYYIYVQAKNAMQTAFTPKQEPYVKIGGAWGEFVFENMANFKCDVGDMVTLEANLTYELENFDYKYQWYKATSPNSTANGVAIAGATNSSYQVDVEQAGSYYYYCVCTGEYNGTKTATSNVVTVTTLNSIMDATVSSIGNQTYIGSAITPTVTVKDGSKTLVNGTDYTVSYSNNVNVGTATVTITGKGNYTGTKSVTFAIVSKNISGATVSSIGNQTYTGLAITPTVTVKDGSKTLVSGTDYTVSYSNNVNVGTATVTITGKGNYTGTKSVTFVIVSKNISGATVSSIGNQTYTGSGLTASVVVKDGSKTLVSGTDYTVSYSNNVNVGTATVTITGKGNYTGTKSVTFAIVSKSISVATVSSIGNQTYTGSSLTPSIVVRDGSKTLVSGTDYTVSYSNNVNV
ncbi:MAG: C1 family peptidase, partial [Lachnospiraceae bacterium]|nr:C1 family peptidase [Lachnospiraceae bacterium]